MRDFKKINEKVISLGEFLGLLSIIGAIGTVAFYIGYPIYNGDFLILSEIAPKCIVAVLVGLLGYILSNVITCIGGLATDVHIIRNVYEQTYAKVEEHESQKKQEKPEKKKVVKQPVIEEDELEEPRPRQVQKTKKSVKNKIADFVFEEVEDTDDNDDDDEYIVVD